MAWLHSPPHFSDHRGEYFVTTGTYGRRHYFRTWDRLDLLRDSVLDAFACDGWRVEAWTFFSNHYHLVASPGPSSSTAGEVLKEVHRDLSTKLNGMDNAPGRQVFFNYWDSTLTFQRSYLARLRYVMFNPVKHGLVASPAEYPWCSAREVEEKFPGFAARLRTFKTDRVNVYDEYQPALEPLLTNQSGISDRTPKGLAPAAVSRPAPPTQRNSLGGVAELGVHGLATAAVSWAAPQPQRNTLGGAAELGVHGLAPEASSATSDPAHSASWSGRNRLPTTTASLLSRFTQVH
ncbi:MAG: hypothetical protein AB2A00_14465 [Myxococcota bacterium]